MDKDTVRWSYDEITDVYADQRFNEDRSGEILTRFIDSLSVLNSVLDAGCGNGTPVLPRLSAETTAFGLDFSREQLDRAVDAAPSASLVQGI